ncbi:MAG: hypothetical protein NHB36_00145 [Nitrospira sp.]|nr:hypothetical protein [Nitrospira sp.]
MKTADEVFDAAFDRTVDIGNGLANEEREADVWDVADGMLAGAIQFWLYSRQPCGNPGCPDCASINTAAARMTELHRLVQQFAEDSEYYHSPTDVNVGRA